MTFIHIDEVAKRHDLVLFRTSRQGEYKAHCPVCQDGRRQFHLYVSVGKDAFYCHKCGAHGGVIAFHAWLKGVSFEEAKYDLYPARMDSTKRMHPAETLTQRQLATLGCTLRTPKKTAPKGLSQAQWAHRQQAELDWIWSLWLQHQRQERQFERVLLRAGLQAGWAYRPLVLARARRVRVTKGRKRPTSWVAR